MCVLLRGMGQGVCILEGAKGKVRVWEGMRCGCGCGGDEVCVCVCVWEGVKCMCIRICIRGT